MSGNSDFVIENGVLKEYTGSGGDVVIPEGVTEIGAGVFISYRANRLVANTNVKTVTVPLGVEIIGYGAFKECRELTEIQLPHSIKKIENQAFFNCKKLKQIILPDSLEQIGPSAFDSCERLKKITVSAGNQHFCNRDSLVLTVDGKRVVLCPAGLVGTCKVPDDVEEVSGFYGCNKLTEVILPSSVKKVSGFSRCSQLTSINIPAGVDELSGTFRDCFKLTRLDADGVTQIEDPVWQGTSKKEQVIIPLVFPKLALSKVRAQSYKVALTMGYVLEPERYQGRLKESYQKYLEENRELVLELAQRHGLEDVVSALHSAAQGTTGNSESDTGSKEAFVGIEQMSLTEAKALFEFNRKATGVKILRYRGNDAVVDVPLVIGKTQVTLVAPRAFRNDVVIRCSGKMFQRLPPQLQFNTYMACQNHSVKFSAEQQAAMKDYFSKKQVKLVEQALEIRRIDMLPLLLSLAPIKGEDLDMLIEKAARLDAEGAAILLNAKRECNVSADDQRKNPDIPENMFGNFEQTMEDVRSTFKCREYKNRIVICGLKAPSEQIVVPGVVTGKPVELDVGCFCGENILQQVWLTEGVTIIRDVAFEECSNLRDIYLPASIIEIAPTSFYVGDAPNRNLTIHAPAGSYAETYAKRNNIPFQAL